MVQRYSEKIVKETLENPADPRDNSLVIAGYGWVHGRQAARIQ